MAERNVPSVSRVQGVSLGPPRLVSLCLGQRKIEGGGQGEPTLMLLGKLLIFPIVSVVLPAFCHRLAAVVKYSHKGVGFLENKCMLIDRGTLT